MSQDGAPARYIREVVFGIARQEDFGRLLGVSQAQVSRWETGANGMNRKVQQRIRALARDRGIDWNDSWFFEVPADKAA